jgi:hypothetical protein
MVEEVKNEYGNELNNKFKNKSDESNEININKTLSHVGYPYKMRAINPSARDLLETSIIKNLINSYFQVVKKNVNDLVPKTIMCFLINQSKLMAEREMVTQLYKSNELETLLQEDPYIAKKRKLCNESINNMKKSLDILAEFNSLSLD